MKHPILRVSLCPKYLESIKSLILLLKYVPFIREKFSQCLPNGAVSDVLAVWKEWIWKESEKNFIFKINLLWSDEERKGVWFCFILHCYWM